MAVDRLIIIPDSNDEHPPSPGTMVEHFEAADNFWSESERRNKMGQHSKKKKKISQHAAAGSTKRQHALADSSSTADSEDSEEVDAAGSRKCQEVISMADPGRPDLGSANTLSPIPHRRWIQRIRRRSTRPDRGSANVPSLLANGGSVNVSSPLADRHSADQGSAKMPSPLPDRGSPLRFSH